LDNDKLLEIVKQYSENLSAIKSEFVKINESFQSGKDQIASEILTDSIGKMNTLLTALISLRNSYPKLELEKIMVDDHDLASYNQNLNECLSQIALGLERNDLVEAGDLIEYELPELLDGLKPFLDKIIEKLEAVSI